MKISEAHEKRRVIKFAVTSYQRGPSIRVLGRKVLTSGKFIFPPVCVK